jgi:hypothetical protein
MRFLAAVGRDVEEHGDVESERRDQLELERAQLQHIGAVGAERLEAERRRPEIAADLDGLSGSSENVADQRRRGRFAVGAGDADGVRVRLRAAQQFDIADDRHAGGAGARHRRVRRGEAVRDTRRQHQCGGLAPRDLCRIAKRDLGGNGGAGLFAVVPGQHLGAPGGKRRRRRQPGAGKAEHRDLATLEPGHGDHRATAASRSRARRLPGSRR